MKTLFNKHPKRVIILFLLVVIIIFGCGEIFNLFDKETTPVERIYDGSGNVYTFVTIGTQDWLVENLKTTKYNDGTDIPLVEDSTAWNGLTTPGYCWYDNDQATYGETYGALYNWHTINTGKLCPDGWHVPTDAEWTILTDFLGGENIASGKLKESGTTHWNIPNTGGENETGFTALPGGYRDNGGAFSTIGSSGYWWSSSETNTDNSWNRLMGYDCNSVYRLSNNKGIGFSVRCLRD